jgi:hypothetical protein
MPKQGWKQLLAGWPWFRGQDHYPIAAYSEFMPPPRLIRKAYSSHSPMLFDEVDPWGWPITEYEEAFVLRPGLEKIAKQVVGTLAHLCQGRAAHGIARNKLADNPYWPAELAEQAGKLAHERYVVLLPLALSLTQDDKGRIRWTLFGNSEQGPARAFWKSFYTAPRKEVSAEQALAFVRRLLGAVYKEPAERLADLHKAGFRILAQDGKPLLPFWKEGALPRWTTPYRWTTGQSVRGVRYLLTFRPFGRLPAAVRRAYLAGDLHLLPFPGSLLFCGALRYLTLQHELPLAMQIPLLQVLARHEGPYGIRIPQSGWLHEPHPEQPHPHEHHGPLRNSYRRTHRWARVHRDEDELALEGRADKLLHVLFSTLPDDLGLYDKPMARNAQIWNEDYHLLLDGPNATHEEIHRTLHTVSQGGLFGYRFLFPAMRVGQYQVYWQRPLAAYWCREKGEPVLLADALTGYLTAYHAGSPDLLHPVELWPRFFEREPYLAAVRLFEHAPEPRPHLTARNIRKLLDTRQLLGGRLLPRTLARRLLTLCKDDTLEGWLESLPSRANDPERARRLVETLRQSLEPDSRPAWHALSLRRAGARQARPSKTQGVPPALTFAHTARRSFEVAYWETIVTLAEGRYRNKNNADCARDPATQAVLLHHHRDLEALGNYLVSYYAQAVAAARMTGKALVGDLPFTWETDFEFPVFGGWLHNQAGSTCERNIIVVIPGRDRSRAVIMADHYDTAYMEDHYDKRDGGKGARLAAAGADDNHSATAALMRAAPIFLQLSRERRLACDIWLVHLTGEEFPADCLGARRLCQCLVEGNLKMRLADREERDLSRVRVQGVYVSDMIAHNNDHDRDVFQIAPGSSRESMWLAYQAHLANETWNASAQGWNRRSSRRGLGRGKRSADGSKIPAMAAHPHLHGEVRPPYDPRSTLYNTDGQIFSDAGIPVVLFMENYDINRSGYHDSHDTMANIDLDYGAGVAAIAIEAVARAATEKPGF